MWYNGRTMKNMFRKMLSHDASPFVQFVKYGAVGVMSTLIQMAVFYFAACTFLKCLTGDDMFVKLIAGFGFDSSSVAVDVADGVRALNAAFATGIGFVVANIFCWAMNRLFVFKPGRHSWIVELLLFFAVSLAALGIGIAVQSILIKYAGWTTSSAFILEIISSFVINYVVRKFFIFKG
jgi:putative flippase GtrA